MTKVLLDTLLPIFAGLALGYVAGRRSLIDNANVGNLIVLTMSFAIPCALFSTIARASRTELIQHIPVALILAFVFCTFWFLTYFWSRRSLHLNSSEASVLALTIGFPNSAAIGLSLFQSVYGGSSTITAALSVVMGAITISPLTLAFLEARNASTDGEVSTAQVLRFFPAAAAKPVVWAPVLGILCGLAGIHLPAFLLNTVSIFASAGTACALVLTGVIVSAQRFSWDGGVAWSTLLKLLLQPAFAFGFMFLLHVDRETMRLITVASALPSGFFGLVFGKSYDAMPKVASSGLIASYIGGAVTLPLWLILLAKYS